MLKKILYLIQNRRLQALISVLGFGMAIYAAFGPVKRTDITYQLVSDGYAIEIKEKLGKLDVLYDGKSLKENNQALRVITFKVSNSGNNTIRIGDYDPKLPLGFSISHGEILEVPQVSGSKDYLVNKVLPQLISKTTVTFSPVIMEPGDFFTINILVLVSNPVPVKIIPSGVLAGLDLGAPTYHDIDEEDEKPSIMSEATSGSWRVQAIRLPAYFFGFIAALITIPGLLSLPRDYSFYKEDKNIRKKRIGMVNQYIAEKSKQHSAVLEYIFTEFTDKTLFYEEVPNVNGGKGFHFESLFDLRDLVKGRLRYTEIVNQLPESDRKTICEISEKSQYRWRSIAHRCKSAEPTEDQLQLLIALDTELTEFLSYLKEHDYAVGYSTRMNSQISIFFANPYSGKPNFQW